MKRVAIISDSAPPLGGGGIASAHYSLYKGFQERGIETKLFTFFETKLEIPGGTEIQRFGPPLRLVKNLLRLNRILFSLLSPRRTAWYAIDSILSGLGVLKMRAALEQYQPDYVIFPDQGSPALFLRKPAGARWGLIAHHNPKRLTSDIFSSSTSQLDAKMAVWFENLALRKIDRVTCPSQHMKEWFESTYQYGGPLAVIPNVPDSNSVEAARLIDPRPMMDLPSSAIVIVIPSGSVGLKGTGMIEPLLSQIAITTAESIGVVIAGEIEKGLKEKLSSFPDSVRLHCPGRLPHSEYLGLMKACSFGLFPALRDNYSMALVEATLAGVPMLAFDAGGNADIIASGRNGLLFAAFDWEAMAKAASALVLDAAQLESLRASTKHYRPGSFNPTHVVNQYIQYFLGGEDFGKQELHKGK